MQTHRRRVACAALTALALAALGMTGPAQASPTGSYAKFAQCPYASSEVSKCIYSVTESGEVVLGSEKVPIERPVVLQGGYGPTIETRGEEEFARFYAAADGETLSKVPQSVPGGLAGIVPEASSPPLVKALVKFFLENSLTGLNSTVELAGPASAIRVSENDLGGEFGTALEMPVKFHLENPLLGANCYIGSASSPIIWKLTTGTTSPPPPNKPITGAPGVGEFLEGGSLLALKGAKLVDNSFAAPAASGCGGPLGFLVNPIVNSRLGLTAAGHNTAILAGTLDIAAAVAVKANSDESP
jgi:hypothetical protein